MITVATHPEAKSSPELREPVVQIIGVYAESPTHKRSREAVLGCFATLSGSSVRHMARTISGLLEPCVQWCVGCFTQEASRLRRKTPSQEPQCVHGAT